MKLALTFFIGIVAVLGVLFFLRGSMVMTPAPAPGITSLRESKMNLSLPGSLEREELVAYLSSRKFELDESASFNSLLRPEQQDNKYNGSTCYHLRDNSFGDSLTLVVAISEDEKSAFMFMKQVNATPASSAVVDSWLSEIRSWIQNDHKLQNQTETAHDSQE